MLPFSAKHLQNKNKPKMAYSRDAFTRDQQETRERQDQRETRERLERDKKETREIWSSGGWPIIV